MSFGVILEIINGVLKFPDAVLKLVRVLQKTPAEKRDDLLKKMDEEFQKFEDTGRPTW
jgi:hypothetical protein